ncbi:MEKHLA domain-containing protein [Methyloligella solikamskensis]|uniref:MEKHLA domain-containing protein n=1 Tax=Methyloligella solikamskensis TaxID=1177756 RepID=A0ABW3JAW9_9HYPH
MLAVMADPLDSAFFDLLTGSYRRLVGTDLVVPGRDARWLYEDAPFAVLAHNTDDDPRFVYGNRTAQSCFEMGWDEIVGLPSRYSAEAPERGERQRLLEAVARDGFGRGYRGIRIAKSGRRFFIEDGVIWQLIDDAGTFCGQAATFARWTDV